MNKNVYSVILSTHVVEQLDKLAYQQGRSRSAMIEAIIAQHLSISTPEAKMVAVLGKLAELFAPGYKVTYRPPATSLVLKNRLRFKYNPTIQYTVSLRANQGGTVGHVSIQVRTQSEELVGCLNDVYAIIESEQKGGRVEYEPGEARMQLTVPVDVSTASQAAESLFYQISGIDRAMMAYFTHYPDVSKARLAAAAAYQSAVENYVQAKEKEESA